jgi:hypothetical protein
MAEMCFNVNNEPVEVTTENGMKTVHCHICSEGEHATTFVVCNAVCLVLTTRSKIEGNLQE